LLILRHMDRGEHEVARLSENRRHAAHSCRMDFECAARRLFGQQQA
jgi:hypothetical protein